MNNQRNQRYNTGRLRTFDDDIQNIVESVINEYLTAPQTRAPQSTFGRTRQPMSATAQSNTNAQGETYVEYMSLLHALRDIMLGYNTAMRDYSQNISTFLQIMQSVQYDLSRTRQMRNQPNDEAFHAEPEPRRTQSNSRRSVPTHQPQPARSSQRSEQFDGAVNDIAGQLLGHILQTPGRPPLETSINRSFYTFFPNLRTAQEDVVVAPTAEQITNSTEEFVYSDEVSLSNTSCPITLEEFQDGDDLQRILQCRHTFKKAAIQNWFRRNVRCPVCRCDIRDYLRPETQPIMEPMPSIIPDRPASPIQTRMDPSMNYSNSSNLFNEVSSTFSNLLNNYYTENPTQELIYSVEYSRYFDLSMSDTVPEQDVD